MKVAIIGAGLAGLACAHELERYGVNPVIYERSGHIGDQHPHVSAILEIIHRPKRDIIEYFRELGLDIRPLTALNNIIHHSPNKSMTLTGNLGYMFLRDRGPLDFKQQIYSKLKKTKVLFNEFGDYEDLRKSYDYVVIANGASDYTKELGVWKIWLETFVKGAVVLGNFDPTALTVWIDKNYCKNGYVYMTPFNDKKASIAMVASEVNEQETDVCWEMFLAAEDVRYPIVQEFKLNHSAGFVYPHRVGNIFFVGNAAGVVDPFLGFGQIGCLETGVMAARSISTGQDYEKLIAGIVEANLQLMEFRKSFNRLDNSGYDKLLSVIGLPGIRHAVYYSRLNAVKYGAYLMRLISNKN